ncbi:YqhA family protein [Rhodoblastus sp.]|uniref:YqhA family protein n=1 Tax=Rhodoblastus sp. TaxID=1962975 RepID=UPI0035B20460
MDGNLSRESDRIIVRLVLSSRWAMAPLIVGLIGALALLVISFLTELWGFAIRLAGMSQTEVILNVLTLIDLTLIGGLLVIVIQSGYENFVEKINRGAAPDSPEWMTRISFGGLKLKLFASLMAITAITLLKAIMKLELSVSETQVRWLAAATAIFIVAYAVLAFTDRFTQHGRGDH